MLSMSGYNVYDYAKASTRVTTAVKILMLGWELPPYNSGGLGVACYQLCKALTKKGADIEFVVPYTAEHKADFMRVRAAHPQDVQEILEAGAAAYDSTHYSWTKKGSKSAGKTVFEQATLYEQAVEKIVQEAEFDIIHSHDWLTARAAIRAKMLSGKPLFVHLHSVESDRAGQQHGGNPLVREVESLALHIADRIIAVSDHTRKTIMREYHIPKEKIEVVHNSFDPGSLEPASDDNSYLYLIRMKQQGYKVIASVGRLTIQKGLRNLLYAFKSVVERAPKTLLVVVGSGEQRNELIQLAADLGIGRNVIFTGFQRGKRYRDAYSVADLFVMPSVSEPFGLVALEAIGYGTPVLITRQSGVAEIIHNSLQVDFWDINQMANKMVAVVQNEPLRDELHANSYHEYKKSSWNKSADKLWEIYSGHTAKVAA